MDTQTARRLLREHLLFLQEMGFQCLETEWDRSSAPSVPEAARRRAGDQSSEAIPGTGEGSRGEEERLAVAGTEGTGRPTGGPAALARAPTSGARAEVVLEWPMSLFTRPARSPLQVANPPMASGESRESNVEELLLDIEKERTGVAAAKTPDLFAEEGEAARIGAEGMEEVVGVREAGVAEEQGSQSVPAQPVESRGEGEGAVGASGAEWSYEERVAGLSAIAREAEACQSCRLFEFRRQAVPGQGNPGAQIVFVGEGPGEREDAQGLAFVGRAGQLLTDMIQAMQLTRDDVFICNVLKCRPPGNRVPAPDEMAACEPFLKRQLEVLRPAVIVALGGVALKCLLRDPKVSITRIRGKWQRYEGIPLMPTFHPAYLLRNPSDKAKVWEDLQKVMRVFGLEPKSRGRGGNL